MLTTILLIGERGLLRELLRQHLEDEAALTVVEVELEAAFDSEPPFPSAIILIQEQTNAATENLIVALRRRCLTAPICVISGQDDRQTALHLVSLGVQGLVSTQSCVASLVPILRLLVAGETFLPASAFEEQQHRTTESPSHDQSGHKLGDSDILTARERQVAQVLLRGKSNKEIARELSIKENTVKIHVRNVLKKLGARSRSHAIVMSHSRDYVSGILFTRPPSSFI